jgi:hypothetical protein
MANIDINVDEDELASALADLDAADGPRRWSFQEQARFVLAVMRDMDPAEAADL